VCRVDDRLADAFELVAASAYGLVAKRPYVLASLVRRIFRTTFADQLAADHLIEASDLRPGLDDSARHPAHQQSSQTPGPAQHRPVHQPPYSLSRAAYASALLDLAENHAHSRQIVNITG
jgi:hypothetical protein